MKKLTVLTFLLITSVLSQISFANGSNIIYDNSVNNYNILSIAGTESQRSNHFADDFSFERSQTVTDVHWWGAYLASSLPNTDNFDIFIYNDNNGVPTNLGTEVYSHHVGNATRIDTGLLWDDREPIYEYSAFIEPFYAETNTYWLDIYNPSDDYTWWWAGETLGYNVSPGAGNAAATFFDFYDGGAWGSQTTYYPKLGFLLTNDAAPVPEPSTFLLLGVGLAGLGFVVRRRRKE